MAEKDLPPVLIPEAWMRVMMHWASHCTQCGQRWKDGHLPVCPLARFVRKREGA